MTIRRGVFVRDPYDVALEAWGNANRDYTAVPASVIDYATVQILRNEVTNGSFAQYFTNSYGDELRRALVGLEAIDARHSVAIVRAVMALFGPEGPSLDQVARQQQLDNVDGEAMEHLSEMFLTDSDDMEMLLARHVARYAQHFQRH